MDGLLETNMNKKEAIDKIKKCLALAKSANEHEAAAALRQAQALMERFSIDDDDVLAAEVSSFSAKSANKKPSNWEAWLSQVVAESCGCRLVFRSFFGAEYIFIGCGVSSEIACYAFQVLHRQCKKARAGFIKSNLKRCKTATKTKRADIYCEGWVRTASEKITALVLNDQQTSSIEAYMSKHHPKLSETKPRDRNDASRMSNRAFDDFAAGAAQGANAELNRGVGGQSPLALK